MSGPQEKKNSHLNIELKKRETPIRVTDKRFWVNKEKEVSKDVLKYSFKPTYIQELEKKVNEVQKNAELEVQKSRERIRNEYEKRIFQSKGATIERFLDVFENLERAVNVSSKSPDLKGLIEGVGLIHNQFTGVLNELGLKEVIQVGQPFNPEIAEAVEVSNVLKKEQDNCILKIITKGYYMNGLLIRPAKVKVGQMNQNIHPQQPKTSLK